MRTREPSLRLMRAAGGNFRPQSGRGGNPPQGAAAIAVGNFWPVIVKNMAASLLVVAVGGRHAPTRISQRANSIVSVWGARRLAKSPKQRVLITSSQRTRDTGHTGIARFESSGVKKNVALSLSLRMTVREGVREASN